MRTISCGEIRAVVSYHHIPVVADATLGESFDAIFDAVVLPYGPEGSVFLVENANAIEFVLPPAIVRSILTTPGNLSRA